MGKTLFLEVVKELNGNHGGPAKLEGIALGPDVESNGTTLHTLWVANDNDFLRDLNGAGANPNQFFVVYGCRPAWVGVGVAEKP